MVRTRYKVNKGKFVFAIRNKKGQFKDIQSIGRAVKADAKRKAKHKVKSGFGYLGDIRVKAYRRG